MPETTVPKVAVLLSPDEVGMLIEITAKAREDDGFGHMSRGDQRYKRMCDRILDACQAGFAAYCGAEVPRGGCD